MSGVITAVSTVLSVTCAAAWRLELPGGRCGPRTQMTSGVAIRLVTIVRTAIRRMWFGSFISDDVEEAAHVADCLHGPAEAGDEALGAGHEALPAVVAGRAGAERERDRSVRHVEPARRL